MKWFGEHWGAAVCDQSEHAPTPTGARCYDCRCPVVPADRGLLIPHLSLNPADQDGPLLVASMSAVHLACFLRTIGVGNTML